VDRLEGDYLGRLLSQQDKEGVEEGSLTWHMILLQQFISWRIISTQELTAPDPILGPACCPGGGLARMMDDAVYCHNFESFYAAQRTGDTSISACSHLPGFSLFNLYMMNSLHCWQHE